MTLLAKQHQGLVFMNFKSTGNNRANLPERLPSIMRTFPTYSLTISALVAFVVKKK